MLSGQDADTHDTTATAPTPSGRAVFISLSALLHTPWAKLEMDPRLDTALFFFGSKRSWAFPSTEAERQESKSQNPAYLVMSEPLRACILAKEAQGLVFWLKPEGFVYDGGLYSGDPTAFGRASAWLQGLCDPATGAAYQPLLLDPSWWRGADSGFTPGKASYTSHVGTIIKNFENGAHDYNPVCELIVQSNPSLLPAFN